MAKNKQLLLLLGIGALAAGTYYVYAKKKEEPTIRAELPSGEIADVPVAFTTGGKVVTQQLTKEDFIDAAKSLEKAQTSGFIELSEGFKELARSVGVPLGAGTSSPSVVVIKPEETEMDAGISDTPKNLLDELLGKFFPMPTDEKYEVYGKTREGSQYQVGVTDDEAEAKKLQNEAQIGNSDTIGRRPIKVPRETDITKKAKDLFADFSQKLKASAEKQKAIEEERREKTAQAVKQTVSKIQSKVEDATLRFERQAKERREKAAEIAKGVSDKLKGAVDVVKKKAGQVLQKIKQPVPQKKPEPRFQAFKQEIITSGNRILRI